jgi:hypothetical protein
MSALCNSGLFGGPNQYIKFQGGDAIAVSGANTFERLILSDVRIPYRQLLKGRVILKAGQVNYLMNHLGLGDNATFVAMKVTYDRESTRERDNYVTWNYYDDTSRTYPMKEMMVLTGNSSNRIRQMYLTNPNTRYAVTIDIMVAVIDDESSFFQETNNQIGISFTGLTLNSFETYILGQSVVIYDNSMPRSVLAYISLTGISDMERVGNIITMNVASVGAVFLSFVTEDDTRQTLSLLKFVINNPGVSIQNLPQREDTEPPIIFFNGNLGGLTGGSPITLTGTSSIPVNSSMWTPGETITTVFDTGEYTLPYQKESLVNLLVDNIEDNRDGTITVQSNFFELKNPSGDVVEFIPDPPVTGTWSMSVSLSDIAGNVVPDIQIELTVV